MSNEKLLSNKQVIYLCLFLLLIWTINMIILNYGDDNILDEALGAIDEKTIYTLKTKEEVKEGRLGEFYNCLKSYRSISTLRTTEHGDITHAQLIISKNFIVQLSIIKEEAFRFSVEKFLGSIDEQKNNFFKQIEHSDSYAINCELSLLSGL